METEIWKDVQDFPDYKISTFGRVESFKFWRWKATWIMSLVKNRKGYLAVWLSNDKGIRMYRVHRLVAQAFLWLDINDTKTLVCHRDDDVSNNHKDNLFLWTNKDNVDDMIRKWRANFQNDWLKSFCRPVNQYTLDWKFIKSWSSMQEAARSIWVSNNWIRRCCVWYNSKTSKWFIWKFSI